MKLLFALIAFALAEPYNGSCDKDLEPYGGACLEPCPPNSEVYQVSFCRHGCNPGMVNLHFFCIRKVIKAKHCPDGYNKFLDWCFPNHDKSTSITYTNRVRSLMQCKGNDELRDGQCYPSS